MTGYPASLHIHNAAPLKQVWNPDPSLHVIIQTDGIDDQLSILRALQIKPVNFSSQNASFCIFPWQGKYRTHCDPWVYGNGSPFIHESPLTHAHVSPYGQSPSVY